MHRNGLNQQITTDDVRMTQYAVYRDTSDYPGKVVVRRWFVLKPGHPVGKIACEREPFYVGDVMEMAEVAILRAAPHAQFVPRDESDDPVIVGVWL